MTTKHPGLKWYININKHVIKSNINAEVPVPPITIRRGKSGKSTPCMGVRIPDGSHLIYNAKVPILKCGARLVIECPSEPEVVM